MCALGLLLLKYLMIDCIFRLQLYLATFRMQLLIISPNSIHERKKQQKIWKRAFECTPISIKCITFGAISFYKTKVKNVWNASVKYDSELNTSNRNRFPKLCEYSKYDVWSIIVNFISDLFGTFFYWQMTFLFDSLELRNSSN